LYNNAYHSAIGMSPAKMFSDPELEKEYILGKLEEVEKQRNRVGFEIPIRSYVRFILPRADGLSKKRYQLSPEKYLVTGKQGLHYILMAADGNIMIKPRFMLRVCNKNELERMKFAETIPGAWSGMIKRVIEDVGRNHVRVAFEMPNGDEYLDVVPRSYLRK